MLLSGPTYNNFKEVHTFIFIPLVFINFHIIEMQSREGEIRAEGRVRSKEEKYEMEETERGVHRLELGTDERGERRRKRGE